MSRIAFLFPGQGAQYVGLGRDLCATSAIAKSLFDRASEVLGYDLLDVCVNGPAERINATNVSQPAIFVASMAALEQLRSTEPNLFSEVVATAGLSLGEYTALTFAGALTFEEALRVVQERGEAMQAAAEATPSGMVSIIGMEVGEVEALVAEVRTAGTIEVANLLCPGNTVVSGEQAAIDQLVGLAESRNLRAIRLSVAGAFHTNLMKPADERLAVALANVTIQKPRIPVWCNFDATPHTDPELIRERLISQVLSPVRWEETVRGLLADGVDKFYEIGPGRVLAGLLKRVNRKSEIVNISA